MTGYLTEILNTFVTTMRDVAPIAGIMFGFQFLILRRPLRNLKQILFGFLLVLLGMAFFLQGLEQALFPIGRLMAQQLTDPDFLGHGGYLWLYIFAAAIGFSTTIAEPSLIAVAIKANQVSAGAVSTWGLRIAVAIGVAVGISLGSYRIISGIPLHYFIITGYVIVMLQTIYCPKTIIALAYDSGGVTTSTVTVPLVTALGLGLATSIPGRNPLIDGFGLIAFASLFPIMSVMAYAKFSEWYSSSGGAHTQTTKED